MKRLNFFPYYEKYLRSKQKTTTFRLGRHTSYVKGDTVVLTIGWNEKEAAELHEALITDTYFCRIRDLSKDDFDGESPDCKSAEATALVLSSIYKKIVSEEDEVLVVKFAHRTEASG